MGQFLCFIQKYMSVAEFFYYVFAITGVIVAVLTLINASAQLKMNCKELRLNTEAQQDLLSPLLILSYSGDRIGGLQIENVGKLFAKNIVVKLITTDSRNSKNDIDFTIQKIEAYAKVPLKPNLSSNSQINSIQSVHVSITYDSPLNDRTRQYSEEVNRNA